jgi:PAS domain S-box-containing protein
MTISAIPLHDTASGLGAASLTQALIETMDGQVALLDKAGIVTAVNQAWREHARQYCQPTCPYRCTGALGADYLNNCHMVSGPGAEEVAASAGIRDVLAGVRPAFVGEYGSGGHSYRLEIQSLAWSEGGFLVVHHDITERRQATDQMRLHSLVLDQIQDMITVTDMMGQIVYVNRAQCAIQRRSRAELEGAHIGVYGNNQAKGATQADVLNQTLATGHWRGEVANRTGTGDEILLDLRTQLVRDGRGEPVCLVGICTDVTQQRQRENLLRESELRYRSLFDATPDAVFLIDETQILMANPAALSLLGVADAADIVGWPPREIVHPRYYAVVRERFQRAFLLGQTNPTMQIQLLRADGQLVDVEAISAPFDYGGKRVVHAVMRDITQRLQAERALRQSEQELSQNADRLAAMSRHLVAVQEDARRRLARELHDRTSPNLAAIGINLDVVSLALRDEDWATLSARMDDNRALIEDTAASIREICADLRPPALDYAGLVPAIEAYLDQYGRRMNIASKFNFTSRQSRLPPDIESTLFRITQEALTNVAKHAGASTVCIELDIGTETTHLEISDDGRGFNAASSAPATSQGLLSGQGLLNMREMAEFAGGRFSLHASPGLGTRLQVVIDAGAPTP